MKISIELIPRDQDQLLKQGETVALKYKDITAVNVPDLLKFSIRSWEACDMLKEHFNQSIAHIRAIDFDLKEVEKLIETLKARDIKEVLVLTGDKPQDMRRVYPTTSLDLIRKIKAKSDIKVYAAVDQYRGNIRKELELINMKQDAGADGFFTQPFFDLRYLEIYMDFLYRYEVYWGITPILSENAVNYWEIKNNVVFPKDFEHTADWNISFTKKAMSFLRAANSNLYLMPVKANIEEFLSEVFREI